VKSTKKTLQAHTPKLSEDRKAFLELEQVAAVLATFCSSEQNTEEARELAAGLEGLLRTVQAMASPSLGMEQLSHFSEWFPKAADVWGQSTTMSDPIGLYNYQHQNLDMGMKLISRFEGAGIKQRVENVDFQLEQGRRIIEVQPGWNWSEGNASPRRIKLLAGFDDRDDDVKDPRLRGLKLRQIRYVGPVKPPPQTGPKRSRGSEGTYCYPSLEAVGIIEGTSAALGAAVAFEVTANQSLEHAQERLRSRNIRLGKETIGEIAKRFGLDAVALRLDWIRRGQKPKGLQLTQGQGKVLFIAPDGFYLQVYRTKKGRIALHLKRHGKWTKWTESKLFTIREYDLETGKCTEQDIITEGTLGNPDDMFTLLCMYLFESGLDLSIYDHIVLGSDGADWITDRMDKLAELLVGSGVEAEKISMLLDWAHVYRKLWHAAKQRKGWNGNEHKKWYRAQTRRRRLRRGRLRRKPWEPRQKKGERKKKANKPSRVQKARIAWVETVADHLWEGDIETVLAMIDELRVGMKAKEFTRLKGYISKNAHRMQYKKLDLLNLPVGTGAIESAGRQTVGLRMARAGTCWKPVKAEGMVMMRCYLMSGRWEMLAHMVLNFRARRFDAEHPSCHRPINEIRDSVEVRVPVHPKAKGRDSGLHAAWVDHQHSFPPASGRAARCNFFAVKPPLEQ